MALPPPLPLIVTVVTSSAHLSPQVLRRFLLSLGEEGEPLQHLLVLGRCEVEDVSRAQHARLLRLLVDAVLGCEEIREVRQGGGEEGGMQCVCVIADRCRAGLTGMRGRKGGGGMLASAVEAQCSSARI